jgi:hypothetical protein
VALIPRVLEQETGDGIYIGVKLNTAFNPKSDIVCQLNRPHEMGAFSVRRVAH